MMPRARTSTLATACAVFVAVATCVAAMASPARGAATAHEVVIDLAADSAASARAVKVGRVAGAAAYELLADATAPASAPADSCCVNTVHAPAGLADCGGDRPVGAPFAGRSPVLATNGAAASSQPLVTQTALDIMKQGGNAVDAAIAANAMQALVEPMSCGPGGDQMAIIYDAEAGEVVGYNGSGRSSATLSYEAMLELVGSSEYIPGAGPLSVTVPGAVEAWCRIHDRYGTLPLSELLAPAIQYARAGFPVSEVIAAEWQEVVMEFRVLNSTVITSGGKFPRALEGFLKTYTVEHTVDGHAPQAGELFTNPDLATTLEAVAQHGCGAGFYNGSTAAAIAAFADVGGTHLTAHDFAAHEGAWVTPANVTYRDRYRVFELPPNPQGLASLQALNILETFNMSSMPRNGPDYVHVSVEAKKLAFADRAKYYADPNFYDVPVEGLIDKAYAAERAKLINMQRAAEIVDAGSPKQQEAPHSGDTIYLTTADRNGTMVSWIQSNYEGFGSGLVVPGTGFALQSRGSLFALHPANHSNVYAPGKRPFHTIIPGFAMRDEMPWLSFGVMGGNMQPQGHVQVLLNMIEWGMNVQEAGDAARWRHSGSSQPTGSTMTDGGAVGLEGGICDATRAELASRGHHLTDMRGSYGGYQAIMRDHDTGVMAAGSEMRKDGQAAGY